MNFPVRLLTTILPVVAFLICLILLDSFKLLRPVAILRAMLVGVAVAFASLFVNLRLLDVLPADLATYSRYVGPAVEEILKAAFLVYLVRSKRVGFAVEAAIYGFAIGAGFAIVENILCLNAGPLSLFACVLRGFGTAVMHGGATALFGIVALNLSERYVSTGPRVLLPALGIAYVVHSLFNHLLVSPALTVVGLIVVLPLVFLVAFRQSERVLRNWLGTGFDTDADLVEMISTGRVSDSQIGRYFATLKERFPPEVLADMLCLLRIHAELSVRAKGILLMREAGFDAPTDPEIKERLEELQFLEKSVGKTGMLAMAPLLRWRTRDLWQIYMLKGS